MQKKLTLFCVAFLLSKLLTVSASASASASAAGPRFEDVTADTPFVDSMQKPTQQNILRIFLIIGSPIGRAL